MELETKRLLLRPLRDDDAYAMTSAVNNYEVSKNLARVAYPYSLGDAKEFINLQRGFEKPSQTCAIAFRAAPDELIGVVAYEANLEFGYWLRQCCWNMGLMSEAAAALLQHAMTQTDIPRLKSGYHTDNPNSGRILRKLGFIETHVEMNFSVAQNKDVPVMKMVLTRETWSAAQ
jgi:RimJ/RimL family protein N-acetyltransferase